MKSCVKKKYHLALNSLLCLTALLASSFFVLSAHAKKMQLFENTHKTVSSDLIFVRKNCTQLQDRIYVLLDNIDRMSTLAKEIYDKKRTYKTKYTCTLKEQTQQKEVLTQLSASNNELKNQTLSLKNELGQEKIKCAALEKQRQELLKKVALYEKVASYEEEMNQKLSTRSELESETS